MNTCVKRLPCALWCCMLLLISGLWPISPVHAQEPAEPSNPAAQLDPTQQEPVSAAWVAWDALPVDIQIKVDPRILDELRGTETPAALSSAPRRGSQPLTAAATPKDQTRFLVYLTTKTDLAALDQRVYASAAERRAAVVDELKNTAEQSQAPLKALLADRQRRSQVAGYQPFYIVNAIAVEGDLDTVTELAQRGDVERIVANYPLVRLWDETPLVQDTPPADPPSVYPWNITKVGADQVWRDLGITGKGAVVGGFDTGVNYRHPALSRAYRGSDENGQYTHDYNWFEPGSQLYPNGDLGPSQSNTPYDCDSYGTHGTHTMGTMVGDGGRPETAVGLAPGARWIAVPGICAETMPGAGLADDIGGIKAFQWFLCPTDLSGELASADCSQAPHVINNSWGSSNPSSDVFRPAIAALRAAGVTVVFAAGNSGLDGSIGSPAHLPETIAVGATTLGDGLAFFSSRGPAFGNLELKPNVSAPGNEVLSSVGAGEYAYASGTSMAAPHVAGLIALLISADLTDGERNLSVDELESFVANTAVDLGASGPDVLYGHGRIDAYKAVRWLLAAGDLRGLVRDRLSGAPVANVHIRGDDLSTGETFSGMADASGAYSLTVPAGLYQLTLSAWGYETATFANQRVLAGALSIANLDLQPIPQELLTGTLRRGSTTVADARIYVKENPMLETMSAADGSFALSLPTGQHTLVVEAQRHRRVEKIVNFPADGAGLTLQLEAAPSILLVNADASAGWFYGWPVHPFMAWALDQHSYLYDLWSIDYTYFIDRRTLADGAVEYGVPSAQTLLGYDVVIWMHSGCSSYYGCSWSNPALVNADEELSAYLEGGGRLLISGQDLGAMDGDHAFYDRYLHADVVYSGVAIEGRPLIGSAFLGGINVDLSNGSLYGAPNSVSYFDPDMVVSTDSSAYPVLRYESGEAAALAVDPCNADYRVLYMAVGYENIAPRGEWQSAAISDVVARSVAWLSSAEDTVNYRLMARSTERIGKAGQRTIYQVQVDNVGKQSLAVDLAISGNRWAAQILEDGAPAQLPLTVTPCGARYVQIVVEVPADVPYGAQDSLTLTASTPALPVLSPYTETMTTRILPFWDFAAPMPNNRMWMATAAMPGTYDFYTVGGDSARWYEPEYAQINQRYNVCANVWETLAPLPQGITGASAGAIDGKLYVAGGRLIEWYDNYTSALYIYDPAANTWSQGAALPAEQGYAASAVVDGKLYLFGGQNSYLILDHTLIYDPALNGWRYGAPVPNGPLFHGTAAALDGEIYVIDTGISSSPMSIYNPAANSWRFVSPPPVSFYSASLVAASDGYLYFFGGASYEQELTGVIRYHPPTDSWEVFSVLQDRSRYGSAGAFVAGKLIVVGGSFNTYSTEVLTLTPTFCDSGVVVPQQAIEPGGEFTVGITLQPEVDDLPNARVIAPIPLGATFGGFVENSPGASYNEAARQVEWQGSLIGGGPSRIFTYTLRADADLQPGARLGDQVTFDSGGSGRFVRDLRAAVYQADFSASSKQASASRLGSGERLTYTIDLLSLPPVGAPLALQDALPASVQYVPDSLSASTGVARYDAAARTIYWQGEVQPSPANMLNLTNGYLWGDSAGNGDFTGVSFAWTDIVSDGTLIASGDSQFVCDLDIGFSFPFYGKEYSRFCVHTDGYITFAPTEVFGFSCSLPTEEPRPPMIAGLWTDLVVEGGIYAKVIGSAPHRQLIVQWDRAYLWSIDGTPNTDFQVVLSENGDIQIHLLRTPPMDFSAIVGVQDADGEATNAYACTSNNYLYNHTAVRFLAPGQSVAAPHAQIQYGVRLDSEIAPNTWITNTAWITSTHVVYDRSASVLANPMDLGGSTLTVSRPDVKVNEAVGYRFHLRNSGQVTASGASLLNALPSSLAYLPDSLSCSTGSCGVASNVISWTGDLPPQQVVTVAYSATLTSRLANGTPVTNSAQLDDGQGNRLTLSASILVQQAELSASFIEIDPALFFPGDVVTYTVNLYNSGGDTATVALSHTVPSEVTYEDDSIVCGAGQCSYAAGTITWQGLLPPRTMIPVRFRVAVSPDLELGHSILSVVVIEDQTAQTEYTILASFDVVRNLFLPGVWSHTWRFYLPTLFTSLER